MMYKNINTGEVFTLEEIKAEYQKFQHETPLTFEETMKDFEEITLEWFQQNSNNGILTDGIDFFVDLGLEEGSSIPIKETEYAPLLNGSEEEFHNGIVNIDNDTELWEELFRRFIDGKQEETK